MKPAHTLLITAACLASPGLLAQNSCTTALSVGVGTHTVPAVDGEAPQTLCVGGNAGDHGEWYRFYSAAAQQLTVTTDLPVNTGRDTRVHIYSGSCTPLVCVGGDDDGGSGYLSTVSVPVNAGTYYYIVFDDYWEANGFDFQVSTATAPPPVDGPTFTATGMPVSALGIVDMNNDQRDDLVGVGNTAVNIGAQQAGGGFSVINMPTPPAMHMPSWSMCAGDIDGNGKNDLMYGGGSGVTFMLQNDAGDAFVQQGFNQYIFSQRTNMVDLDNDGELDAFVCHDVDANVRFINQGDGQLEYLQGGTGNTCGNYGSLWTDVDNDGLMDLFVAKCGCDPVDILMLNEGSGMFTSIAEANGFVDSHQSWSSAWGDFDNDGDMDVLVGSSSSSIHKLMRNNGDATFTNVTPGSGYDAFSGSSIEWTTHDFDNDGYLDIMGGGKLMMGHGDLTFSPADGGYNNGPVGDLDSDGFLDFTNGSTAYMNDGNANHWIRIFPVGVESNTNGIGARIEVISAMGTQIREIRSGDGFRYMSSLAAHFGLGTDTEVDMVVVRWPSGNVQTIFHPEVDEPLVVVEANTVGVAEADERPAFTVHPNPVRERLQWQGGEELLGRPFEVIDATGRVALQGTLQSAGIDVAALGTGTYTLRVAVAGGTAQQRFVKQ